MFVQIKNKKGLTLIELLVVIAILGILASFTSVAMIGRQKQARDAQRKSDLQQVKRAMQSIKNDCKAAAYYPFIGGGGLADKYANLQTVLKNGGYMANPPEDPKFINTGLTWVYMYDSKNSAAPIANACPDGTSATVSGVDTYWLQTHLETTNDPDGSASYTKCSSAMGGVAYTPGDYYVCSK